MDGFEFPLTDLQEAYVVGMSPLIELGGFRPHFYLEFDVAGLRPERAERVLNQLIAQHDQLRTVVLPDGGQRVLETHELPPFRLPVADLTRQPPAEQDRAVRQVRERMAADGLDPGRWPMFDVAISVLRPNRARLHLGMSLLLLDAHSTWQIVREAAQLLADPGRVLPHPLLSFRQCRQALLEHRSSPAFAEHHDYWTARLDSLPDAPALPLRGPLPDVDPVRFVRRSCRLTAAQWQHLGRTARRHRILPAAALAHLFAETLGTWAAVPHFCLNVLHQGWRGQHPEWAGVVGQLGATLPLEVDLRADDDFWARGRRLQGQLWRDLAHSDVTAVEVMREVAARRGWMSRAALPYVFNSMLGAAPAEPGPRRPTGVIAHSVLRTPHVLIDNQIQDLPDGGVNCVWDVVDDAFAPGLPAAMFHAYQELISSIGTPDGADQARPEPGPAGHRRRVAELNRVGVTLPAERLEAGFLRQAARDPEALAVLTPQRTMTYRDLEQASRAVAGWLLDRRVAGQEVVGRAGHEAGEEPGQEVVAVVMVKGWEQVVAVLGVLRAGAAYCPVDATLPTARIRRLVDGCGARLVLGQPSQSAALSEIPLDTLFIDELDQRLGASAPKALPPTPNGAEDLAYVIHTSGSTGVPKGVMIEHRGADTTIRDLNLRIGLTSRDRVFGISSLSFDLSVWDIFGTLSAGAALVLPAATEGPAPIEWAATAAQFGVTVWNSVPALAEMLAEVLAHRPELGRPPVRAFLLSGDWIPLPLPDRLRAIFAGTRIVGLGGATEASIWSNSFEVERVDPGWRSIPYGTPLTGQTIRVLDHRYDVRPPWATGRIYIGGAGLARGYLADPVRTAERFVHHPVTGERLYWTGDLGKYWPDGTIEFLGREDRQVKLHGFRVEPGEVEAAIRSVPGVRECAVTVDAAADGRPRLVALAVPGPQEKLDEPWILDQLRGRLPHYMVPAQVHVVSHLPLTANGKVDVARALATMLPARAEVAGGPPSSPLTARLSALWCELLGVPVPGPAGDFFALGGNSLLALRLVHRIRQEFGVDLPLGQIFEARTVGALAARLENGGRGSGRAVRLGRDVGGSGMFLFHPVGGSVAGYDALAQAWPGSVYAFQSPGLTGRESATACPDLETMAAGYLEELLRLAPGGPYLLGGWSMGGVLAHEVGRQLTEQGHRPAVFMIDSEVPDGARPAGEAQRHLAFLTDLAAGRIDPTDREQVLAGGSGSLPAMARELAVQRGLLPDDVDVPSYQRLFAVYDGNLEVLSRYRPGSTPVPTLLFVAAAVDRPDPVPAWRAVCAQLEVESAPFDHHSIVGAGQLARIARRVGAWSAPLRAGAHR